MWQLKMTNAAQEWVEAVSFETVTAARRIREIEGYPVAGLFFQIHVDTQYSTDAEAFSHLEHTGRRSLYVLKRQAH